MKYEYQNFQRRSDLVIPILCVWRVEFDWNSFLGMSATCLDRNEDLKQALEVFSVLKILAKNASLLLSFGRSLGLLFVCDSFYTSYAMCLDENYGQ